MECTGKCRKFVADPECKKHSMKVVVELTPKQRQFIKWFGWKK